MSSRVDDEPVVPEYPTHWQHRHLLDLERLTAEEITLLLDTAEATASGVCSQAGKAELAARLYDCQRVL